MGTVEQKGASPLAATNSGVSPDRGLADEYASLPNSFRTSTSERSCGAISLSALTERIAKEIYFTTVDNAMYCIAKSSEGKWACFDAATQTGRYLSQGELSVESILQVGEAPPFASSSNRAAIADIRYTNSEESLIKLEFLGRKVR